METSTNVDGEKPELQTVKMVKILTPAKFSVIVLGRCRTSTPLKELESEIAKTTDYCSLREELTLVPSMYIVFREPPGGQFCRRGYVTSVNGDHAEIFLCDYGIFTNLNIDDWNSWAPMSDVHRLQVQFRAAIVVIPGLIPARCIKLSNYEKCIPTLNWTEQALPAVQGWFDTAEALAMTIFSTESSTLIYGDFYKVGSEYPISYFLQTEKLGMIDGEKFTKLVLQ